MRSWCGPTWFRERYPPGVALLLRPDRPGPGPGAGLRAGGRDVRDQPGQRPARRTRRRGCAASSRPSCRRTSRVGLSVPVTDGVASVDLRGDAPRRRPPRPSCCWPSSRRRLRQEPTITAVRVSIGGKEVHPPGAAAQYDVSSADEFDPADTASTGILYGLRRGRIVAGSVDDLRAVDGPLGREPHEFASVSVAPVGDRVAAVSADGRQVVVAPLRSLDGTGRERDARRRRHRLHPAVLGRLGSTLAARPRSARSPGPGLRRRGRGPGGRRALVTGADARRILVSRDGTLLIALVTGPDGDQLVAARIVLDSRGRVAQVVESRR